MLSRLVLAALVAEFAAIAALDAWLSARLGWPMPASLAFLVLLPLGTRFVLVCLTSLIAWFARSPRPPALQIGLVATIRMLLVEYRAMLVDSLWFLPFPGLALRPDPLPTRGGPMPVLAVHGYFSNRAILRDVTLALEKAGQGPVHAVTLDSVLAGIDTVAGLLEREIDALLDATGHAKLILVCHSMGGLAARRMMRGRLRMRIAKVITIASPHHGTVLARIGIGSNARQMRAGGDWIDRLAGEEAGHWPCPVTSIWSVHDNLVAPQETSRLEGARNIALAGLGHVAILFAPDVHRLVVEEVRLAR
jgi:triacylglycerol esterase/lipase EstA (alpha/beta hydrolase family)